DRLIITDRTVDFNRPDIVLINKEQRRGIIIDIAVPLTHNIQKTEREKIAKYENLSIELKRLWKLEKVETYALVISSEGGMTTRFAKNIVALGLSYNIIRNGQKAVVLQTCHILISNLSQTRNASKAKITIVKSLNLAIKIIKYEEMGKPVDNEVELRKYAKEVRSLILEKHDIDAAIKLIREHEEILTYNYGRSTYLSLLPTIRYENGLKDKYQHLQKVIDVAFQLYEDKEDYEELAFYAAAKCDVDKLHKCLENMSRENRNKTREGDTILVFLIKYGSLENRDYLETVKLLVIEYKLEINKADYKNHTPILLLLSKYDSLQRKKLTQFNDVILNAVGMILSRNNVDLKSHTIHEKNASDIIELYELTDTLTVMRMKHTPPIRYKSAKEDERSILFTLVLEKKEDAFLQQMNEIEEELEEENPYDIQDGNNTLLQLACEKNLKKIVSYLLKMGATLDKTTKRNENPPRKIGGGRNHYTIFKDILNQNKIEIDSELFSIFVLNRGRQIKTKYFDEILCYDRLRTDIVFQNGNTPLHYAIYFSNTEAVLKLLKRGAPLTVKNKTGKDPLNYISKEELELYMDQCLLLDNHNKLNDKKYELGFDFSGLVKREENTETVASEVEIASRICSSERLKSLAKHPLMMTFIELKWNLISGFYRNILLLYAFFFICFFILSYQLGHVIFLYLYLLVLITFFTLQPPLELSKFKLPTIQDALSYFLFVSFTFLVYYLFKNIHFCIVFVVFALFYQFLQQHLYFSKYQAWLLSAFRKITPYLLALFALYTIRNFEYSVKNSQFTLIMLVVITCIIVINHSLNALIDSVTDIEYSLKTTCNKNALKFIKFYENIYPFFGTFLNDPFIHEMLENKKGKRYRINFYINRNKFLSEKLHFIHLDTLVLKKLQDFVLKAKQITDGHLHKC
ncbi:hypothetical protein NQ318_004133, partial [Aromia moschata]